MTLNGLSRLSTTNCWARWLTPIPVRPAITAGIQPPDGVTETTHPDVSAASIEVVPRRNASSNDASASSVPASEEAQASFDDAFRPGTTSIEAPDTSGWGA